MLQRPTLARANSKAGSNARADDRAWAIAPACGIAKGMEVGADYTLPHPRDTLRATGGLAFKWVPEGWLSQYAGGRAELWCQAECFA